MLPTSVDLVRMSISVVRDRGTMVLVSINYTPIRVEPPDDGWAEEYRRRADAVREALGEVAQRVDHVGSTAIPGLDAKPTIDIQVSVADLEDLESFRRPLELLGYTFHERSLEEVGHRFFSAPGRAAHIHICPSGSRWERTHLLFRDFVRTHPDVAGAYSRLKHSLAREHPEDREAYAEAKSAFIEQVLTEAERWAWKVSWSVLDDAQ
jgi:GrpB-like predicted nucleotidyltransferase (UPF0157 family)